MRKVIIKTGKYTGIVLLSAIMFVGLYFTTAFLFSRITIDSEKDGSEDIAIYIKTNGVHTDVVVPVRTELTDWSKEIKYANTKSADSNYGYVAFGWGDKGFYLQTPNWADLKLSVAFNAAFWRSTSAIHATYYETVPENMSCRKIKMSRGQYARLVRYIQNSFQKDKDGHFIYIRTDANYGQTDAFYEAKGRYSLLCTCNTWANRALKECGQRCCLWTIFDTGDIS